VSTNAAAENRDYGTSRWQLYDEATPFAYPRGRGATNGGAMTAIGSLPPNPCNSTRLQSGRVRQLADRSANPVCCARSSCWSPCCLRICAPNSHHKLRASREGEIRCRHGQDLECRSSNADMIFLQPVCDGAGRNCIAVCKARPIVSAILILTDFYGGCDGG
jgi:hypothetical protein